MNQLACQKVHLGRWGVAGNRALSHGTELFLLIDKSSCGITCASINRSTFWGASDSTDAEDSAKLRNKLSIGSYTLGKTTAPVHIKYDNLFYMYCWQQPWNNNEEQGGQKKNS